MYKEYLGKYYSTVTWEAYLLYIEGQYTMDELMRLVMPLIGIVIRNDFTSSHESIQDDMASDCAAKAFQVLKLHGPPTERPNAFTSFLKLCFRRQALQTLIQLAPEEFDLFYAQKSASGSVRDYADAEHELYQEQFNLVLRRMFLKNVRFLGQVRNACLYILNQYLLAKDPAKDLLVSYFKIPSEKLKFYCDYVAVLYRGLAYALRESEDSLLFNSTNGSGRTLPSRLQLTHHYES